MTRRKPWLMVLGAALAVFTLAFFVAACGDDEGDGDGTEPPPATEPSDGAETTEPSDGGGGGSVDVSMAEFTVTPASESVASGEVTFNVTNDGNIPHNFRVLKSDLGVENLPTTGGIVDEAQVEVTGSGSDLNAGESEALTVTLEPGSYVLICNVQGHYEAGMRTDFTAE